MIIAIRRLAMCAALSIVSAGTAAAAPGDPKPAQSAPEREEVPFSNKKAASEETLNRTTGREDLSMVAQSQQASSVSRSSVSGTTTTGEISIADNAFQNATGLTVINANTGNNVAMNASLNVNIVMTGPQ